MQSLSQSLQFLRIDSKIRIVAAAVGLLYLAGGLVIAFVMVWLYKLGASFLQVGLVGASYNFALAISFLAGGALSDRYGGRAIFVISLLCSLVSAIFYGIAGFLAVWIPVAVGLVLGKVALGLRQTSSFSIITQTAQKDRKATSFGFVYTLQQLGYVIGPMVGGVMILYFGWASPFLATVPIISVAIFLILVKLNLGRATPSQVSLSFQDVKRSFTLDRGIMALTVIAMWNQFFEELSNPFFMIFLEEEFNPPPFVLGLCFTAMSIATLLFTIPGGLSSDITGKIKPFITASALMMTLSMGLVAFAFDPMMFVASYFLAGITFAINNTMIPSYFADATGRGLIAAYGVRLGGVYLVVMYAPAIGGWMIETYGSIRLPFEVSLFGCAIEVGLVIYLFGESARQGPRTERSPAIP